MIRYTLPLVFGLLVFNPQPLTEEPVVVTETIVVPVYVKTQELTTQEEVLLEMYRAERLEEFSCLAYIFEAESSWDPEAVGDGGDSFGLPQRHSPSHGKPNLPWPVGEQVKWAIEYAEQRYGSVCQAKDAWEYQRWW